MAYTTSANTNAGTKAYTLKNLEDPAIRTYLPIPAPDPIRSGIRPHEGGRIRALFSLAQAFGRERPTTP